MPCHLYTHLAVDDVRRQRASLVPHAVVYGIYIEPESPRHRQRGFYAATGPRVAVHE